MSRGQAAIWSLLYFLRNLKRWVLLALCHLNTPFFNFFLRILHFFQNSSGHFFLNILGRASASIILGKNVSRLSIQCKLVYLSALGSIRGLLRWSVGFTPGISGFPQKGQPVGRGLALGNYLGRNNWINLVISVDAHWNLLSRLEGVQIYLFFGLRLMGILPL